MIKRIELASWDTFLVKMDNYTNIHLDFYVDNNIVATRIIENDGQNLLYHIDETIEVLGHECVIKTSEFGDFPLIVNNAIDFYDFDSRYTYDGNDLGSIYAEGHTNFKLWAPLAYRVYVVINDNEYEMMRIDNGVFYASIDGNFDGARYIYRISMNGKTIDVIDPYGKSSTANGTHSFVINPEKCNIDLFDEYLPEMKSNLDAIIYEANVRDMTIDEHTDIVNKGKFLGLIEKGRKTRGGHPAGFDHIVLLGITHLQLMPVLDFVTVDEANPDKTYNWGYDPQQYFTLEGSYATDPNDPYSRIREFKKLVRDYHRAGIRINLDVVYNHVYEAKHSIFDRIVPNYYFRRDDDGSFLDHSYCGNELASERPMVRKLILDSVNYLIDEYHIDGFRFDLMGLMDIETMKRIVEIARSKDKFIMLYGEGWDMGSCTSDGSDFATMGNANQLPEVAFFNDRYRNIARGIGSRAALEQCGYLLGNLDFVHGFKFVYMGSAYDITYPKLFNLNQSINYVECHDNATLFDVIKSSTEVNDIPRLIKKINKAILLSFGIPFIHAGQEIGLTKHNHHNTYNKGDKFNKFDYSVLDNRYDLVNSLISFIKVRKAIKLFNVEDENLVDERVYIEEVDDLLHIIINDTRESEPVYHIFINPTNEGKRCTMEKAVDYFAPFGYRKTLDRNYLKQVDISPLQVGIFIEIE
jgi:pullulanase